MCLYGHANKARCCCWSGNFSWINSLKTPRIVSVTGYLSRGVQGELVTKSLLAQDLHLDILCKKPFQSKNYTFIWRDVFSFIGCGYSFQSLRSPNCLGIDFLKVKSKGPLNGRIKKSRNFALRAFLPERQGKQCPWILIIPDWPLFGLKVDTSSQVLDSSVGIWECILTFQLEDFWTFFRRSICLHLEFHTLEATQAIKQF